MWDMHDGAPAHFSHAMRDVLNNTYYDWWIGTRWPPPWPSRSTPDLNPLDFYVFCSPRNPCVCSSRWQWRGTSPSATTPASLHGCGGPWWDVSRCELNLMKGILSTY
jgi:hypothetical protein